MDKEEISNRLLEAADDNGNTELSEGEILFEMVFSPELAGDILRECNTRNVRKVNLGWVGDYARDQQAGNWGRSYDCVVFNDQFILLNGQHRLSAQCQSGSSVKYLVVIYAEDGTKRCMDRGGKRGLRTTHDISNDAAAVCRLLIFAGRIQGSRGHRPTPDEVDSYYRRMTEHVDWAIRAMSGRKPLRKSHVCAAFAIAHYRANEAERGMLLDLAEDIVTMCHSEPMGRVIVQHVEQTTIKSQADRTDSMIRILHGIRNYLDGKQTKILRPATATREKYFPGSLHVPVSLKKLRENRQRREESV